MGQTSAIFGSTAGTDTVKGAVAKNIVLPMQLSQEYDYSYQIIPTQTSGDSVHTYVALYQSNAVTQVWTEITSARDTITSTAGCLVEGTNAPGLYHRITLTGVSTDSSKFKVNYVLKLEKHW